MSIDKIRTIKPVLLNTLGLSTSEAITLTLIAKFVKLFGDVVFVEEETSSISPTL